MTRLFAAALSALLGSCAVTPPATAPGDLGGWFDCLRTRGEAVVSAHRGGPAPGFPENALATVERTLSNLPGALVEIDVQQSADGVLILFHDDQLDRRTNGSGAVQRTRWAELAALRLRDADGRLTGARIPTLDAALRLVVARGAVAQLDVKRGVDFAAVVAAVRAAGAVPHSILITYNDADALTVARLAPEMMVSATLHRADAAEALVNGGVRRDRLLGWTGTRAPDPALFAALRNAEIEPIFGTLGSGPDSLDRQWLADGDAAEFRQLEADGAVLVATDRPAEAAAALGPVSCRR